MERSSKLLIVIGIGLILLAIGLWILLSPILMPTAQPPALPPTAQPTTTVPPTQTTPPRVTTPPSPAAADLKRLEDRAAAFVSRVGSGSSADGFLGYDDVQTSVTAAYRIVLAAERTALQKAHPPTGSSYGITTRVVTSQAQNTALDSTVTVVVQVQQAEDAGDPSKPTTVTYKEATTTLEKQSTGGYLVSGISWKEVGI